MSNMKSAIGQLVPMVPSKSEPKNQNLNLSLYKKQKMHCPVTGGNKLCYYIPFDDIDDTRHNPARPAGTDPTKALAIQESLISFPTGQEEPICVEWSKIAKVWNKVFGYNRDWAARDAFRLGFAIANHPANEPPGIWAWIFTGSPAEKTTLQLRENANKKPHSPATKQQVVKLLGQYISQGGFGQIWWTYSDTQKYDCARKYMMVTAPIWGSRKFKGVWNLLTQNGNSKVALSFRTWSKDKLAEYFCAHNPYGIVKGDLDAKLSGSKVIKNGKKYGIYFVSAKTEIAGALPTNASKLRVKRDIDEMIVVCAFNDSTVTGIKNHRKAFVDDSEWWNTEIKHVFDHIYFMPQTKKETDNMMVAGQWAEYAQL